MNIQTVPIIPEAIFIITGYLVQHHTTQNRMSVKLPDGAEKIAPERLEDFLIKKDIVEQQTLYELMRQ